LVILFRLEIVTLKLNLALEKENSIKPLVSIITVVYNSERFLEKTIKSIINQTYSNVEYILIDGASTDGTVDIIKIYEKFISKWISEKDNGLYDAMNKAIEMATGDYLWFY
jgi:glycosyltransferase involved in cell wall biosynthesis